MSADLIQTKLFVPRLRPSLVSRPRLIEALDRGRAGKLTLISAPAGFGKTTLVRRWIHTLQTNGASPTGSTPSPVQVAWLSLDENDGAPARFLAYVIAALQRIDPQIGGAAQPLLQVTPLPLSSVMTALINDVLQQRDPFVLVLDDYHRVDSRSVDQALAFLVEHAPPQLHLVITTREDPDVPLARLRARGVLTELRAADLRFSAAETADFLRRVMALDLTEAQIVALEARTEGWIAGLQMAAISLENRAANEREAFVNGFTGSHRFVLDYLVEEVLLGQRDEVRDFLLATSILDRLSGPLCAAVAQIPGAQPLLEALERENLFVVPLDDERHWYRYHHLFAEVLRAHARAGHPERLTAWHRRASDWFAAQGAWTEAIRHALAGDAFSEAAGMLELLRFQIDGTFQIRQWLNWARQLPSALVRERPVLSAGYGWALLENGELAACVPYFEQAERWLAVPTAEMVVSDREQQRLLPAILANARAYRLLARGDGPAATAHAQRALDFFQPEETNYWRQVALSLLGVTHWIAGDVPASAQAFARSMEHNLAAGKVVDAISNAFVLAEFQVILGQRQQAEQTINRMVQLTVWPDAPLPLGADDLYRVLAYLAWERGDKAAAESHLHTALRAAEAGTFTNGLYRLRLLQASFKKDEGEFTAALALLDEAESIFVENPLPLVRPIAARRADVWIAQGELGPAQAWAAANRLSADAELSYLREFELLVYARLLLANFHHRGDAAALDDAVRLLARLLAAAEAGQRHDSVMRLLLLQAQAVAARRGAAAALPTLERALTLAASQGVTRPIVAEGEAMVGLLKTAVAPDVAPEFATRLLTACGEITRPAPQPLVEPLSERELEILGLIAAGLKNREIAERLFISLNTVLYHNKNIYGKLGVNKRALAIAKAREAGFIQ